MAVSGDIAKLTMFGSCLGQDMLNVFFYRIEDAPTEGWMSGLATEFLTNVLTPIRAIQSANFNWRGLQVLNIFNLAELYELPLDLDGNGSNVAAELMPSFVAYSFRLQRSNANVRNGRKHIGGVAEEAVTNGSLAAAFVANVNAAADGMAAALTAGAVDVFEPVIVGRVPYVSAPGVTSFRLPQTQVEMGANWSYVSAAQYRAISTMNSRKVGRGS